MSVSDTSDVKVQAIITYFRKVDAGDASYLDLFDDDVKFFFPKFGTTQGKKALVAFGDRIGSLLGSIWHDISNFNLILCSQTLVVEGQEGGTMKDGTVWPGKQVSQGLFAAYSSSLAT